MVTFSGELRLVGGGTPPRVHHYASPEALSGMPLDSKADIWGIGAVLLECFVPLLEPLRANRLEEDAGEGEQAGLLLEFWRGVPYRFQELGIPEVAFEFLGHCLQYERLSRVFATGLPEVQWAEEHDTVGPT